MHPRCAIRCGKAGNSETLVATKERINVRRDAHAAFSKELIEERQQHHRRSLRNIVDAVCLNHIRQVSPIEMLK